MRLIATDAIVLHLFDYRETSRIIRLLTRDAGVVSAVARGARRPRNRFGAALDLFASGTAHLAMHPTRDLHALHGFDATRSRPEVATSLDRFGGASVVAEVCLRFGREDAADGLHDAAMRALDLIAGARHGEVTAAVLASVWRLVAELGFAPALELCATCHSPLPANAEATFHHRAGGALCPTCARRAGAGRRVPAEARATVAGWLAGADTLVRGAEARAHARLLHEFLEEHLIDGRPLRAYVAWEDRHRATTGALA